MIIQLKIRRLNTRKRKRNKEKKISKEKIFFFKFDSEIGSWTGIFEILR